MYPLDYYDQTNRSALRIVCRDRKKPLGCRSSLGKEPQAFEVVRILSYDPPKSHIELGSGLSRLVWIRVRPEPRHLCVRESGRRFYDWIQSESQKRLVSIGE